MKTKSEKKGTQMSENVKYILYGDTKNKAEMKLFIDTYFEDIKKKNGRYMITLKHVAPGAYVLDYGCGWGAFSKMVVEHGCRVDAIDLDANSIKISKDFIKESDMLKFRHISIEDINDEIYDCVISSQVIEHTHNPGNYLMECNRVLKYNGFLLISLPNIINLRFLAGQFVDFEKKFRIYFQNYIYDKTHDHIQAWDPLTFMRLLNSMGFEYVAHEFMEGMALPIGKYLNIGVPRIKNLSYTMLFKVQKKKYVKINGFD